VSGGEQGDPLVDLWQRAGHALAPFGIPVGREVLALWRDQAAHGHGPIRAAQNGQMRAVEDLIALLRLLTGTRGAAADDDARAR